MIADFLMPAADTAERSLLRAILEQAIRDVRHPGRSVILAAEARDWLFDDGEAVYSARWVCEHLGVDLARVRRRVGERRRKRRSATPVPTAQAEQRRAS